MPIAADYSAARLAGSALRSSGFSDAIRYAGTPGRTKNTTAAEIASLKEAGFTPHGVYENGTTDFAGGYNAGVSNAKALLADAVACSIPGILFMSADQHLTAAQIPVWKNYLRGALTVLGNRMGAYGFSEAIIAAKEVGVPFLWQCGSRSALVPGVHLYQRNTGGTTVSGVSVDINDILRPLAVQTAPSINTQPSWRDTVRVINSTTGYQGWSDGNLLRGMSATEAAQSQATVPAAQMDDATWQACVDRTARWDAALAAAGTVTLTDAQFTQLTKDVASAVDSAVGTLSVSVSPADRSAIADAVATVLAARLTA